MLRGLNKTEVMIQPSFQDIPGTGDLPAIGKGHHPCVKRPRHVPTFRNTVRAT